HRLGQLVGDWFERYFVLPMLEEAAARLNLYLNHRFQQRRARGDKLIWRDEDGNTVDYDFVLELEATDDELGIPVGFLESFWRRGKRHSKDKARDDSGKLVPMRHVHPTARFLGIVAGGDFTAPARDLIRSRGIDLFYVPKDKIVAAFRSLGLEMDYPDRISEESKRQLADGFERELTDQAKKTAAAKLKELVGHAAVASYVDRVHAALGALPQEIRFLAKQSSKPCVFETIAEATAFLKAPDFDFSDPAASFLYEVTYSDGSEFAREVGTLAGLQQLHVEIERLAEHVNSLGT
ncbi:MAG: hypothetical protein ACREJB_13290, partial [Planctomycetaceae bacterium]